MEKSAVLELERVEAAPTPMLLRKAANKAIKRERRRERDWKKAKLSAVVREAIRRTRLAKKGEMKWPVHNQQRWYTGRAGAPISACVMGQASLILFGEVNENAVEEHFGDLAYAAIALNDEEKLSLNQIASRLRKMGR